MNDLQPAGWGIAVRLRRLPDGGIDSKPGVMMLLACRTNYFNKLLRSFGYQLRIAGTDRRGVHEIRPDSERCRTRSYKIGGGFERNPACRNQFDLREWTFQRLDVARTTNRIGRKNLYKIGARFPRCQHLARRHRSRHHRHAVAMTTSNGVQ